MAATFTEKFANVMYDMSARGKIEVTGPEAAAFLHNLCTNDVKGLPPWHGREAFFCTATAKVVSHGWVWRLPPEGKRDTFWLDLDPGLGEKTYQHLDRHLISEDVTLADRTGELVQYHFAGPNVVALTQAPDTPLVATQVGGLTIRRFEPLGIAGVDVLCLAGETDGLMSPLVPLGDGATFDILRVEAGTPLYGRDMDDTTFVAEVGRTAQAISYAKGCYLGQEPIVMARDRGIVQRTMLGLRLEEEVPPGSLLYREGKEVGRTASCVRSPRFGPIALAYVKRGSQTPGAALEVEVNGQRRPATVAALPFG